MKNKIFKSIYILILVTFVAGFSVTHASYSAGSVVSQTNSLRAQNGLGGLTVNSQLANAALAKANDILDKDYFAHTSPDGKTPWDFIKESGYNYSYAGENLAIGFDDVNELMNAWMNSPTHRENILSSNFREIGVAVISGEYQGSETTVAVSEFGSPIATAPVVESSNSTPAPQTQATPTPTPQTPVAENTSKQFGFVKEKTSVSSQSIFAGEEIIFTATITGEVKTLEVQVFDKKYSLLESGTMSNSENQKTYTLKQKFDQVGTSLAQIVATDKYGNREAFDLGNVTVNQTVFSKGKANDSKSFIGKVEDGLKANLEFAVAALVFLGISLAIYLILRKSNFQKHKFASSFRF